MCESIELYAEKRAVDAVIGTCIYLNRSKEETVKAVKLLCSQVSDDYIQERIDLLWENPFKSLSAGEISAELDESRECYLCGEEEDFDDAMDEISEKHGL